MVRSRVGADEEDELGVRHSFTWLDTAPEPMPSSTRRHRGGVAQRVQWSTLLVPNPVRTSFWKR